MPLCWSVYSLTSLPFYPFIHKSNQIHTFTQTISQPLGKMKQGEHVFDVNAEPEPAPEDDDCPDFDADYEEGLGDCEEGSKEHKDGCEASSSGRARSYHDWFRFVS